MDPYVMPLQGMKTPWSDDRPAANIEVTENGYILTITALESAASSMTLPQRKLGAQYASSQGIDIDATNLEEMVPMVERTRVFVASSLEELFALIAVELPVPKQHQDSREEAETKEQSTAEIPKDWNGEPITLIREERKSKEHGQPEE